MELPRSICLLYWSCTPVPEKECGQQKTLSDWIYLLLNCRNSETGLSLSLDHASGMTLWYAVVGHSRRVVSFKRILKTHLFNCVYPSLNARLFFPGLPGAHRAYGMYCALQENTIIIIIIKSLKISPVGLTVIYLCFAIYYLVIKQIWLQSNTTNNRDVFAEGCNEN